MPRLVFLLVLACLTACPAPSATTPSTPAACTNHGEKCKTPGGPLGVCDTIDCPVGQSAPCFKCMPQH